MFGSQIHGQGSAAAPRSYTLVGLSVRDSPTMNSRTFITVGYVRVHRRQEACKHQDAHGDGERRCPGPAFMPVLACLLNGQRRGSEGAAYLRIWSWRIPACRGAAAGFGVDGVASFVGLLNRRVCTFAAMANLSRRKNRKQRRGQVHAWPHTRTRVRRDLTATSQPPAALVGFLLVRDLVRTAAFTHRRVFSCSS
jgi:hypothetical protein